jgi:3-hydroxyisobutyrate dehydrogenase-like beta-hydroxyacid dehydrogenase
MDVGFIGLGQMGMPMALNLLKSGHRVIVYNRTRSKAEALAANGARIACRISDACHDDILITMLSDDEAVEDVMFGGDSALAELGRNAVYISMSTISVALSERLSTEHAKAGHGYVAAPVFGRPRPPPQSSFLSSRREQRRRSTVASRYLMPWVREP